MSTWSTVLSRRRTIGASSSLIDPPRLVPRPVHGSASWNLRSPLRCGARSNAHDHDRPAVVSPDLVPKPTPGVEGPALYEPRRPRPHHPPAGTLGKGGANADQHQTRAHPRARGGPAAPP